MNGETATHSLLRKFGSFLHFPWRDKWLLFETYILLGVARLAINTLDFERLVGYLGPSMVESPNEVPIQHERAARHIAWAVRTASRYTPWKSNCFPQAIAAKYLLRQRNINSTLYLGAAFKARTELEAHAWLRCGPVYVTGGKGYRKFGTVGTFG